MKEHGTELSCVWCELTSPLHLCSQSAALPHQRPQVWVGLSPGAALVSFLFLVPTTTDTTTAVSAEYLVALRICLPCVGLWLCAGEQLPVLFVSQANRCACTHRIYNPTDCEGLRCKSVAHVLAGHISSVASLVCLSNCPLW